MFRAEGIHSFHPQKNDTHTKIIKKPHTILSVNFTENVLECDQTKSTGKNIIFKVAKVG